MHYYLFTVDGNVKKVDLTEPININNMTIKHLMTEADDDGFYLKSIDNDLFLVMLIENDEVMIRRGGPRSAINSTLQKYFPQTDFTGNMAVVKVDAETDLITATDWDLSVLDQYIYDSQHQMFFDKEFDE